MTLPNYEKHRARIEKVEEHRREHASSVAEACKAIGIGLPTYYNSKATLNKTENPSKRGPKPKKALSVQTIVAEPIRSSSRVICLIGDPRDIAEVIKL